MTKKRSSVAKGRPKLFIARMDRLVSRLKSMYYAWRFIDRVDGQLFVLWPRLADRYSDENVGYSPTQIFDLPNFYASGGSDRIQFLEGQLPFPDNAVPLDGPDFEHRRPAGFELSDFAGKDIVLSHRARITYTYTDENPSGPEIPQRVSELFRSIPVHPDIARVKANFYDRFGLSPKNYDVVHVRRGDVFDMWRDELPNMLSSATTKERLDLLVGHFLSRTAPFQFYYPEIVRIIEAGRKIVFTSDSPEVITHFRRHFGPEHFIDLTAVRMRSGIQKAFLDFQVLADARTVIGTSSNFSSFPAQLGGAHFVNVSGSGPEELVVQTFETEFLEPIGVQLDRLEGLGDRLREDYRVFAQRVAGSRRAQEQKRLRMERAERALLAERARGAA